MEAADKLFERAKRLSSDQLSELIARLDEYLSSLGAHKTRGKRSYAASLALSGIANSDRTDVSRQKRKYLAEAYAPRHEG